MNANTHLRVLVEQDVSEEFRARLFPKRYTGLRQLWGDVWKGNNAK